MSQTYFCLHDDAKLDGKELEEELLNKQNNIVAICPACSIPQCQLIYVSELACKCGALFVVIKSTAKYVSVKDVTAKIDISLAGKKHFYVLNNVFIKKFAHKNLYGFRAEYRLPTNEAIVFYQKLDAIGFPIVDTNENFNKFMLENDLVAKYSITFSNKFSTKVLNLAIRVESYNLFAPEIPYPKQFADLDVTSVLCVMCAYDGTKFVYSRV